jgi:hypothetical protein
MITAVAQQFARFDLLGALRQQREWIMGHFGFRTTMVAHHLSQDLPLVRPEPAKLGIHDQVGPMFVMLVIRSMLPEVMENARKL